MSRLHMESPAVSRRYIRFTLLTIGATLFLVFVGGVVRMTGSGMGCPDWPRCFGQLIPPTDISQLPPDYKTRFAVMGREIADFDVFKTWVEYVNRLIGVLIGLFIVATAVLSRSYRKTDPLVMWLSIGALIGVLFEGWLGSKVVSTDLHPGMITVHMVAALLVVLMLVVAWLRAARPQLMQWATAVSPAQKRLYIGMTWLALALLLGQIILGTQVREAVDETARALGEAARPTWTQHLGTVYDAHKVFYFTIVASVVALFVLMRPLMQTIRPLSGLLWASMGLLGTEVILGMTLDGQGMPALAQPLHLLVASLLFTVLCVLLGILFVVLRSEITHHADQH